MLDKIIYMLFSLETTPIMILDNIENQADFSFLLCREMHDL